jgi:hypothetical protein
MYPLGFMFGTCSECCCRNNTCDGFDLEEAFGPARTSGRLLACGIINAGGGLLQLRTIIPLEFSSCFGSGAVGYASSSGVFFTNAGSGYAKFARAEPTLTITGGGEGAILTPVLEQAYEECADTYEDEFSDVPFWEVASVSISGGEGYVDGEQLSVAIEEGDTEETAALLIMRTVRSEPTLTATVEGGADAELSITYVEIDESSPVTWTVDEVLVDDGGTGYVDGTSVDFELGANDVESMSVEAVIRNVRAEPELSLNLGDFPSGTGAVLTPVLVQDTDLLGYTFWRVDSVTVDDGGTGYTDGQFVFVQTDDTEILSFNAEGSVVGGVIQSVTVTEQGSYFKDTGVIESVQVISGGVYYKETPDFVEVVEGGKYYREDPAGVPYVSGVSASADFVSVTVNSDTSSQDFGTLSASGSIDPCLEDFEIGPNVFNSSAVGCRVFGEGLAPNSVITGVRSITCDGAPWTLGEKQGCCSVSADVITGGKQEEKQVRTEQECADRESLFQSNASLTNVTKTWTECEDCEDPPRTVGPAITGGGPAGTRVGYDITVSPEPVGEVGDCISCCGTGGKCAPYPSSPANDMVYGPYGAALVDDGNGNMNVPTDEYGVPLNFRRMCVRWVCRCYEGTGKRGQPSFSDPTQWYEVASTTSVGGPTINGLDLVAELESAETSIATKIEHDRLFVHDNWQAVDGEIKCVVWAFVFYGETVYRPALCERNEEGKRFASWQVTPGDGIYSIGVCNRCD